jgi:hypothetical protein
MAGNYDCNYNGTDRGSASIVLSAGDDRGTVSGVGRSSIFGTTFAAFGYYESSGESSFTLGGATTGASFSGNVNIADGSGSGTWVNYPASGTWTCKKVIN